MAQQLGVIFDVDGVLVDSYAAHLGSWQVVGAERGFEFTEQRFLETFGRTSREILVDTLGPDRCQPGEIAELDARKEAVFRELLARDFPIMDGAVELIDELHAAGYALAVGSSGPPENVQLVLETLQRAHVFRGVVNGMDVTRGKPDPQVFLIAAERLGLAPRQCLVIEDAAVGIEAARRAGMVSIALVSKGHSFDELRGADYATQNLRDISPALVQGLLTAGRR